MGLPPARGSAPLATVLVLAALAAGACGGEDATKPGSPGGERLAARVTRVVDGDTIVVRLPDGSEDRVRYIGVDTPESVAPDQPVECFGPRASAVNERLVGGRTALLRLGAERRDRYGRLLAYVYVDGLFVNAALLRRGVARTLTIPPNDAFAARFERLERGAAVAGRGLWGACDP